MPLWSRRLTTRMLSRRLLRCRVGATCIARSQWRGQFPRCASPVDANAPPTQLVVRYEYPARGTQPPVTLTWYHGGRHPIFVRENLFPNWRAGVLFVGTKNMLVADYNRHKLLPEKNLMASFRRPRPFRIPLVTTRNGLTPSRTAARPRAIFSTPARSPRRRCSATSRIVSNGGSSGTQRGCAPPTAARRTSSSIITTGRVGGSE